jgi:iron complex outermembrane receptor protein
LSQKFTIRISLIILLIYLFSFANAQSDTIVTDTIGINAYHLNNSTNQIIKTAEIINSQSQSLDRTLQSHSGIFIKTYGAGSISTISLRGGSSSQTMISWNGIPINNPMLGLNDLSLIPMQAFQNIQIINGGNTAKYGNGAMTGIIDVSNQHILSQSVNATINTNYGSFNKKSIGTKIDINHKKLAIQTTYQNTTSDNNFNYKTLSGETKTQTHAYFKSESATLSAYYFLTQRSHLKLNYWHQNTFRQIPPTTVQTRSKSDLHDIIHRYNLKYHYNQSNLNIKSSLAYLDEQNNFRDSTNLIFTNNKFKSLIHKTDFNYLLKTNLEIHWGYNIIRTTAQTAFYEKDQSLINSGLYSGINYQHGRSTFNLIARQEWHSESNLPFAPSISYGYKLNDRREIIFKISKEFRAPTANELFWRPGGNSELKPETSWSQEITFKQKGKKNNKLTASLFHRKVDNWVLWTLSDLQFYQATNIASVRSYGLDVNNVYHFQTLKIKHTLIGNYAYVIAENLTSVSNPIIKKGSQLFYKPQHKITLDYTASINNTHFNINGQYVSSTIGTLTELAGYELLNVNIKKTVNIKDHKMDLFISINNLLNKQYRVIERRPMPGRHFDIGLRLSLF